MDGPSFPELLAPAGNLEKLKIAVLYGANAVYLAGPRYSLRAGTDNFSNVELEQGIAFAHQNGAKVYVTLNAFLHDQEFLELPEYIQFLEACGVDAVIVSDLGVIAAVRQHSALPVHLSTQASCLNHYSAQLWKNLGVTRIVLGREISIEEAQKIRENAGIEVELFVHGAMCMAYSGNCTISNYTLARDSNRGGCAQSCRFDYSVWGSARQREAGVRPQFEGINFMSSKDLRGMELIPQFIDAQITSLKIEGRMKSNLYVATTVQAYAKALQACRTASSSIQKTLSTLSKELEKIPNRQYTEASLLKPAGPDSIYDAHDRSGEHNSEYELAGTVVEVVPEKFITLLVQNPIDRQSILEVLTFEGETLFLPTANMKDLNHEPLSEARSNRLVLLPYQRNIQSLNLARKLISRPN
ncbi:MAG: U32 family peptidase [SAR324 cluster bacterium]|nr:U32 family peptidase [SAR324 cluster bacterium]